MAQTVLQQVLILAAMMMLGFLLGKLGKVDRKGADLLSMLQNRLCHVILHRPLS